MPRRPSKAEQSRDAGLATELELLGAGEIVQLDLRFAWARRRAVETRHRTVSGIEVGEGSVWDLWLEEPPGDPPREPDACEASAWAAVERLRKYEQWVRLS